MIGVALLCALAVTGSSSAGPAAQARFLLSVRGTPVGVVDLSLQGGHYRYRSTHLFTRGAARDALGRSEESTLDASGRGPDGLRRASLALWTGALPPAGTCEPVHDELHRTARVCTRERAPDRVTGTQDDVPFLARYDAQGALIRLEVPGGVLERVEAARTIPWPGDVLGVRIPVKDGAPGSGGDALWLEGGEGEAGARCASSAPCTPPPAGRTGARAVLEALAREVHASFTAVRESAADLHATADAEEGACLAHAHRLVERARARGIDAVQAVCGVYLAPGAARAEPHAWVEATLPSGARLALDPTLEGVPAASTHLALGRCDAASGARLLGLMDGTLRLRRATRRE